jgi:hypothetical protein
MLRGWLSPLDNPRRRDGLVRRSTSTPTASSQWTRSGYALVAFPTKNASFETAEA